MLLRFRFNKNVSALDKKIPPWINKKTPDFRRGAYLDAPSSLVRSFLFTAFSFTSLAQVSFFYALSELMLLNHDLQNVTRFHYASSSRTSRYFSSMFFSSSWKAGINSLITLPASSAAAAPSYICAILFRCANIPNQIFSSIQG